jgi:2-keto-4-pentenoate hydratase/2-oxohepta-3-ene-1,7-dioic acid hydratase in catechol pathway
MDKIICVGKNYLKHAIELGDAIPEEPMYFIKPPSTIVEVKSPDQVVEFPALGDLHHEVELVFRLRERHGEWFLADYTIGLDMTLRDLQSRLKKDGQPWEKAKVFKNSVVLGSWHPVTDYKTLMKQDFSIAVNEKTRQKDHGDHMRWKPRETLEDLQRWFPLRDGDLLFTGTPEGVAALHDGDQVEVSGPGVHYTLRVKRR